MAAARVTSKRQLGYALKRRIAALDPEEDHEEVARLTLEVLYGDPIGVHAGLLIGFSCQVAVPSIARVIYRGGGDTLHDVARRIDKRRTPSRRALLRGLDHALVPAPGQTPRTTDPTRDDGRYPTRRAPPRGA
jgi:hypothetical protein